MTSELDEVAKLEDWSEVYNLAENYRQQEQWQDAAEALERAIELRPDFFWSYHHLGGVFTKLKHWQKAARSYAHAVKLDSQFSWSWHNLGDVLTKLKQWQNAAKAYRQAVKLEPSFFWSWHNLGDAFSNLAKPESAIACYLQGICLQPEHPSYQKLGAAFKQGDLERSIQHYRRIIQAPLQNSVFELLRSEPHRLIAIVERLRESHQTHGAIVVCYMVLEIQPLNTDILLYLSQLWQTQDRLAAAIAENKQQLSSCSHSSLLSQAATTSRELKQPNPGRIAIEHRGLVSARQINELCVAVGWESRSLNKLEQALDNSLEYFTAWHLDGASPKELIGFARAVSDGVFQATLLDIAVHPDFQGRGIGRAMVENLTEQLHAVRVVDITLFASPHVTDFYHRLGFVSQPQNLRWMLWCPPTRASVKQPDRDRDRVSFETDV